MDTGLYYSGKQHNSKPRNTGFNATSRSRAELFEGQNSARTYLNCNMDVIIEDTESQNTYSERKSYCSSTRNNQNLEPKTVNHSQPSQKNSLSRHTHKVTKRSSSRRFLEDDLLGFNDSGVIYV